MRGQFLPEQRVGILDDGALGRPVRCITAICPAGPPNDKAAILSQTQKASPSDTGAMVARVGAPVMSMDAVLMPSPPWHARPWAGETQSWVSPVASRHQR